MSEYLPEEQYARDHFFFTKKQCLAVDPISSPGAKYLNIGNFLQPEPQFRRYGSPLKMIADQFGIPQRQTIYNPKSLSDLLDYKS